MKKEIFQTIEIPEGVEAELDGNMLTVKGPEGEVKKELRGENVNIEKRDNQIVVGNKKATKNEKKKINSIRAHIQNMIKGVTEKFEYQLKICYSHFPITVEIKDNEAIIKNFLGEKVNRKSRIPQGVDVKVDKDMISVSSVNKELAGQAAADLEKATKVSRKDRRIFQDGIFIINKAGKEI